MSERKQALVIGINDYRNPIPRLSSAVPDAEGVAKRLRENHGYDVTSLLDGDATAPSITTALESAVGANLPVDSSFVIYFAGHGVAAEEEDGSGGFFLAEDANLSDQTTWLRMEKLWEVLQRLPCRHLLAVFDCCYAGTFRWASTRDVRVVRGRLYESQYDRFQKGIAWQALTSAAYDERASDVMFSADRGEGAGPNGHSPFASALLEGLEGEADSAQGDIRRDGVITATELYQYVFAKIVASGVRQTPGLWGLKPENKGEYCFLTPGVPLNLREDPPLDGTNNPWRGLGTYSHGDSGLFFGRSAAAARLQERVQGKDRAQAGDKVQPDGQVQPHDEVQGDRFVAVVGPSGSGASSLVGAGLLPALDASTWTVVESSPSEFEEKLAAAPPPPGGRRLLVIDPFEEIFSVDPETRAALLTRLLAQIDADDGPTVLVVLRADFEPQAQAEIGERWAAARFDVRPFNQEELREAVVGPANAKALFFEPAELVARIVDDVSAMPGAPPLLSLTLGALYDQACKRRSERGTGDRMLSAVDYEAIGGVAGVLRKNATQFYENADQSEKDTLRRILLRLVSQDLDGLRRRRVDRKELRFDDADKDGRENELLDALVGARLLVVGSDEGLGYVEPAHDELVRSWDMQREWLKQSGSQEVVRAAWNAAAKWDRNGRKRRTPKNLWAQDPRLGELKRREKAGELNALEREFRRASMRWKTLVIAGLGVIAFAFMLILAIAIVLAIL